MESGLADQFSKLAVALVKFQAAVATVKKSETADAGSYKYAYADLGAIQDAIRQPLGDAELAVTQLLQSRDEATWLETTVWHSSGQHLGSSLQIPIEGKKPQDAGSVITYFRRYALSAALGIATEEDDDGKAGQVAGATVKTKPRVRSAPPEPSDELLDEISDLAKKLKWSSEQVRKTNGLIKTEADAVAVRDKMLSKLKCSILKCAFIISFRHCGLIVGG